MQRQTTPSGSVYRRKHSRYWWLKIKFPGDPTPQRHPTNPRTEDEQEAKRQLHERLGERGHVRAQRLRTETVTVHDLLDLYVVDCADTATPIQRGRVEPWRTALGPVRALDVSRLDLDSLCRRWQRAGVTWEAGTRTLADGRTLAWRARDPARVRPLSGASCNRILSVLCRSYRLGTEKLGLITPLTFPHFPEGPRGEYITEDQCLAICAHF